MFFRFFRDRSEGIMRIELDSQLKAEEVSPEIKLKNIVQAQ